MCLISGLSQVPEFGEWDAGRQKKVRTYHFNEIYWLCTLFVGCWHGRKQTQCRGKMHRTKIDVVSECRVYSYPCLEVYLDKYEVSIKRICSKYEGEKQNLKLHDTAWGIMLYEVLLIYWVYWNDCGYVPSCWCLLMRSWKSSGLTSTLAATASPFISRCLTKKHRYHLHV